MKKSIYKAGVILNVVFAALLILSYLSVHISPDKIPFLALLGLFFPFILIINILFLVFRIYKKKIHFLISLIAIILGINQVFIFFAINIKTEKQKTENTLKIMSYNVRMFDLYKWSGNDNTGNNILELIKNENADIICLQEFYSNKKHNWKKKVINSLNIKDYIISSVKGNVFAGNAIFSKYPIVNKGFVGYANNQKCIYADVKKGKDTIRVYSTHLASIHLDRDNYKFMKNIKLNIENKDENIEGVKNISGKLLQAYKKRSHEVDAIFPHIIESPYEKIVCGDFNDTPISYTYRKIKGKLKDSFTETGFGIGNTYAGSLPFFRIDYIFHSPKFTSVKHHIIKKKLSDHYPITSTINL